jgi:hypothetical protein
MMNLKVGQGQQYTYLEVCPNIGKLITKLEDPSFIIYRDILHYAKFGQWPIVTLKVGQGQ